MTPVLDSWLDALQTRHRAALTSREFLKAVRALSARYVEQRHALADRSPLDSAGKRAAFAAYYAPLHFLTMRQILRVFGDQTNVSAITDFGCGTGAASAAWALALDGRPRVTGVDRNAWAIGEAQWNWRQLAVDGHAKRADLLEAARALLHPSARKAPHGTGILLAWTVNELDAAARDELRRIVLELAYRGARILVVEPIGGGMTPWWKEWVQAFTSAGGRIDDWKFAADLPPAIATIDADAGFRRDYLSAKSLWL